MKSILGTQSSDIILLKSSKSVTACLMSLRHYITKSKLQFNLNMHNIAH